MAFLLVQRVMVSSTATEGGGRWSDGTLAFVLKKHFTCLTSRLRFTSSPPWYVPRWKDSSEAFNGQSRGHGNIVLHTDRTLDEVLGDDMSVAAFVLKILGLLRRRHRKVMGIHCYQAPTKRLKSSREASRHEDDYIIVQSGLEGNATNPASQACSLQVM